MAKRRNKRKPENIEQSKPGSGEQAPDARGDFGVPEGNQPERAYTSENTKRSDPGAAPARSGAQGVRVSGVGGNASGRGSSSGGDLDTDIVGVGGMGGVSASGKAHEPPGPDDATGSSADMASGPPAPRKAPPRDMAPGSTVQLPDERTLGQGADAAPNADAGDDAAAGEVSSDEASGSNYDGD